MNIFEKYYNIQKEYSHLSLQISNLVTKWVEEHVGFAGEAGDRNNIGKTNKSEIGWTLLGNNKVSISYAVYKDRWLDYWSEDIYVDVDYDELLKYNRDE